MATGSLLLATNNTLLVVSTCPALSYHIIHIITRTIEQIITSVSMSPSVGSRLIPIVLW